MDLIFPKERSAGATRKNNMNLKKIKKSSVLLALTGIICMSGIAGTVAYFSDFDKATNTIGVGHNTTDITENFPTPPDKPIDQNPEYEKKIWVANNPVHASGYNVDCYVRVSLSYSNSDIGDAVTLKGLDKTNWVYEDGYYYYKKILKEGERTTPLITGFSIDSSKVSNADVIKDFSIDVYEESVQAGNYTDYRSAWDHYLNPIP